MRFDHYDVLALGILAFGSIGFFLYQSEKRKSEELVPKSFDDLEHKSFTTRSTPHLSTPPVSGSHATTEGVFHDYVDLGLPSGTLWATCNLGAENEFEAGLTYQWNMIRPSLSNRKYSFGDAATFAWGNAWYVPSSQQMEELIHGCVWMDARKVFGENVEDPSNGDNIEVNGIVGVSKTNESVILIPYNDEDLYYTDLWTSDGFKDSVAKAAHFEAVHHAVYDRPQHEIKHIRPVVNRSEIQ